MTAPAPIPERLKPPRSLRAVWDEIETAIREKMPTLQQKIPTMGYGQKALKHMDTVPRVICIPGRGSCKMAGNRAGRGTDTAWVLWWREVVLELHIWAGDETATEVLANHVIATIHDLHGGLYEPVGEEWGSSADTKLGDNLVIGVKVTTSWSREFLPEAPATNIELTGSITQPTH